LFLDMLCQWKNRIILKEILGAEVGTIRRHNSHLVREICVNLSMRDNFLLNCNATTWNMLPSEIAEADRVRQFKARFDMTSETWRRSVYYS
ncbi:hypothetical protein BpHYR1_016018, partial [Brachionus plicatilis]